MDAREDLARLVDALRRPGPDLIEGAASRSVDRRETEKMHRHTMSPPKVEPLGFRRDATAPTLAGRAERGRLVDPAAGVVAIDAGRREVTAPGERPTDCRDIAPMCVDHRIAVRV